MKLLCLIPAYNEKGNLRQLIRKLTFVLKKTFIEYKILLIIQGTDGSLSLVKELKKTHKEIYFLYFPKPLGIGSAYKIGFENIGKDITHILTMDADLNHDPEKIYQFLQVLKTYKADIIIGSRFMRNGQFRDKRIWKRILSFITNLFITKLFKIEVHDISSGYRLIKKKVIKALCKELIETGYPSYMEFIIKAKRHGFTIKELPITYMPRKWGESKMNKFKTTFDYFFFFTKMLFFAKNPYQRHTINRFCKH
uniref:Glycosyltransferase n=1 Tax=candidate division CPR3 bacterium TaxID=2268181 RepID=A0A7C4M0L3_UNCC3